MLGPTPGQALGLGIALFGGTHSPTWAEIGRQSLTALPQRGFCGVLSTGLGPKNESGLGADVWRSDVLRSLARHSVVIVLRLWAAVESCASGLLWAPDGPDCPRGGLERNDVDSAGEAHQRAQLSSWRGGGAGASARLLSTCPPPGIKEAQTDSH